MSLISVAKYYHVIFIYSHKCPIAMLKTEQWYIPNVGFNWCNTYTFINKTGKIWPWLSIRNVWVRGLAVKMRNRNKRDVKESKLVSNFKIIISVWSTIFLFLYLNHIRLFKTLPYHSHTLCFFTLLILWFIYIYVQFYVFIY